MKIAVIVFPGSNCDHDMFYALKKIMGEDVTFLWHGATSLKGFDGLSYRVGFLMVIISGQVLSRGFHQY